MSLVFFACNVDVSNVGDVLQANSKGDRTGSVNFRSNEPESLDVGFGRPITDNPNDINSSATPPINDRSLIAQTPVFITNESRLQYDCTLTDTPLASTIDNCMETKQTALSSYTSPIYGTWGYSPGTNEFREISTFVIARNSIDRYLEQLSLSRTNSTLSLDATPSIPDSYISVTPNFWFSSQTISDAKLKVYSHCTRDAKPAFYSASYEVCLGNADNIKVNNETPFAYFNYSEDTTIVHHEMGHVFSFNLFNARNIQAAPTLGTDRRVDFGGDFYSEEDALSEGFSDWYAYLISGKTTIFDWIGKILPQVRRPVSEASGLHPSYVAEDESSRVRYPEFLSFDTSDTSTAVEDSHFGGQILSHFLTHLEKEMVTTCELSNRAARDAIFHLVQETLAELGDLTSKGRGDAFGTVGAGDDTVNMTEQVSEEWVQKNRPVNFRSFAQTFAKHFIRIIPGNGAALCNGNNFTADALESILDQHGLLLFKTYNDDGNNAVNGHAGNTPVTSLNRVYSALLPKSALEIDTRAGQPSTGYYILDNSTALTEILNELVSAGKTLETELGNPALVNVGNSNGNARVTPGEIIGIALNLFNDSNITMGGVQILANAWDHVKVDGGETKMCNTFEDGFPNTSQNGIGINNAGPVEGDCLYVTRENGQKITEVNETIAPVCFIRKPGVQTTWVSQSEYRDFVGITDSECLMGGDDPDQCFFRPIPGADVAWYSKIDANKNYPETFDPDGAASPTFNAGNVLLFEVSEKLPPGSIINCRLRARFTNCEDCWHDEDNGDDDYLDYEFAGYKPFRIFNIQFTVLD